MTECISCSKDFYCGVEAGKGTCWCFMYCRLDDALLSDGCFCEDCLAKELKKQNGKS